MKYSSSLWLTIYFCVSLYLAANAQDKKWEIIQLSGDTLYGCSLLQFNESLLRIVCGEEYKL